MSNPSRTVPVETTAPTSAEIFGGSTLAETALQRTRKVLNLGIHLLACTTDPLAARYLEGALPHLADLAEELSTAKLMLSEALTVAHALHAASNLTRGAQ